MEARQLTKVDRLALSLRGEEPVPELLGRLFRHIGQPAFDVRRGAHGFQTAAVVTVGGAQVAWWGWGGASQKGRSYVDLSGVGCNLVKDWGEAQAAMQELPAVRAKRIDIAADFYNGEVSYDDVLKAYRRGKFNRSGRPPKMSQILPGDDSEGRTVYIGRRGNDVMLRAYEKGKKEFGELPESMKRRGVTALDNEGRPFHLDKWTRLELELRGTKRELPLDVIAQRDQYFAGAYPYLQEVLPNVVPEILVSVADVAAADLAKSLSEIRRQWGSTLFTALTVNQGDVFAVWSRICGDHHNDRLVKAGALLELVDA